MDDREGAVPLLDVGRGAQDVEPLEDHADGAQLAVHPLQSPLQGHLVDETQQLNTLKLKLEMTLTSESLGPATLEQIWLVDRGLQRV